MTMKRQSKRQTKIPVFKAIPHPGRGLAGRSKAPPKPLIRNRTQALHHLEALLAAFGEVDEFQLRRLGNQRPPALWLDDPKYLSDLQLLLGDLRALRELLQDDSAAKGKTAIKRAISVVASATPKFIEGYAHALGTGAAALTIGAAGALLFQLGLGKEVLAPLWERLRLGK